MYAIERFSANTAVIGGIHPPLESGPMATE